MSVILGLNWASPGALGHSREPTRQVAATWGFGQGGSRWKGKLEKDRRRWLADHLFVQRGRHALIGWSAARVPEVAGARRP